jgi:hypothetical protein
MDRKAFGFIVITLVAVTLLPTVRGDDAASVATYPQLSGDQANSALIILAQGRCFNGRCY